MGHKKKPPEPSRNLLRQAIGTAAGYYLWPPVWIDKEPRSTGIKMDLEELSEIGYEQKNPSGISMKVYRDGMFVFDLADWEEGLVSLDTDLPNQEAALRSVQAMTRNRIKLLNTHLACLYTAIARIDGLTQVKMELSPWNLLGFQSFDGKMKPVSPRSENHLQIVSFLRDSNDPSAFEGSSLLTRIQLGRRSIVSVAAIEESLRLFLIKFQSPNERTLLFVDLYMRSCKAFEDYNDNVCLLTAWTLVEALLQQQWDQYIQSKERQTVDGASTLVVNADRRNLLKGRDYSASIITEVMSLANLIPFTLYKDLKIVRQARNDWIHKLKPVSRETAQASIDLAERMMALVENLDLQVSVIPRIDP